ncbi:hypothetical protein BDV95DRAFT_665647 [Massariosphaeria phaeospora]|uniref:Uncharacterized protein n=1 Tax=Massariosphaeria phaeospora TaxID=100035 RepID=A0A7C8IKD6_9PLEO|nr:hypothetical protein BDV95DRAFT_665647 [Massariosphaeria phaeospora]
MPLINFPARTRRWKPPSPQEESSTLRPSTATMSTNQDETSEATPLASPILTFTVGGQTLTTVLPGTFNGPAIIMITTFTLGSTKVLPALSGGDLTKLVLFTDTVTTTLEPTGARMSTSVTALSLDWMKVALAIDGWIQDPKLPKQTAALEGIERFISHAGSIIRQTSRDNDDKKGDSCTRSGNGLLFIGPLINTIRCVANMAANIASTVGGVAGNAIQLQEAKKNTAAQLIDMFNSVKFMTSPGLNPPTVDLPDTGSSLKPSHLSSEKALKTDEQDTARISSTTSSLSIRSGTATPSSFSQPRSTFSSIFSSAASSTSLTISSSSSRASSGVCPAATGSGSRKTSRGTKNEPICLGREPCGIACGLCIGSDYVDVQNGIHLANLMNVSKISPEGLDASNAVFVQPEGNNQDDIEKFMKQQFKKAQEIQNDDELFESDQRTFVPHGHHNGDASPAALFRELQDERLTLGLVNLYGCTSIMVVSKHAVWWSHFWEVPSFLFKDEEDGHWNIFGDHPDIPKTGEMPRDFYEDVLMSLGGAGQCDMDEPPYRFRKLACLVSTGTCSSGSGTKVIIITPRDVKPEDESQTSWHTLEYADHIGLIRTTIRQAFEDVDDYSDDDVLVVDYDTKGGFDPNSGPPHEGGNPDYYKDMQGKFMLRYDPMAVLSDDGEWAAGVELWAEARPTPVYSKIWTPLDCQVVDLEWSGENSGVQDSSRERCACVSGSCKKPHTRTGSTTGGSRPTDAMSTRTKSSLSSRTTQSLSTTSSNQSLSASSSQYSITTISSVTRSAPMRSSGSLTSPRLSATLSHSTPTGKRPGVDGVPGCAHVIANNLKDRALCYADYCNCGGVVAPLWTTTVSKTLSIGCAYPTQPSVNQCPGHPPETPSSFTPTPSQTTTLPPSPPPPSPSPLFAHGTCRIHLKQTFVDKKDVDLELKVYDNRNTISWPFSGRTKFASTLIMPADSLPMNYNIGVHVEKKSGH